MQVFLKFINYNKKFIQEYSQKIMTLINLIVKNRSWKWNENEQATFERLQIVYLNNSVLKIIVMKSFIKIEIDTFDLIIKTSFSQQADDK